MTFTRFKVMTRRGLNVFVDNKGSLSAAPWPSPPPPGPTGAHLAYMRAVQDLSRRSVFTLELVPGGVLTHLGRFVLRAFNGMYVCAENGGGGLLAANRPAAAEWETFVADFHPEPAEYCCRVHLRCADGRHWVSTFGGGGEGLSSTAARAGDSETFELIAADLGSGGFTANARVHVRTASRHYLQAVNGGGGEVNARGPLPKRTPATITPVLTYPDIYRQFDKCFIKVVASLYDYDAMSANDHITAGPWMLWLRDLAPGQEYGFPCEGDGTRVYVRFKIRDIQSQREPPTTAAAALPAQTPTTTSDEHDQEVR